MPENRERPPHNERGSMANEDVKRAMESTREVELTVTGRTSGREISIPVWFVREGDTMHLVPVNGADSDWYKNVQKHPSIRLSEGNADLSAHATPITDPAKVEQILDKFRAKYGPDDVAAYYPKHDVGAE